MFLHKRKKTLKGLDKQGINHRVRDFLLHALGNDVFSVIGNSHEATILS